MKKLMMAVGACVCALGAFATQIYKPTCAGRWNLILFSQQRKKYVADRHENFER